MRWPDALDAAGPGLLVHPWQGQMQVVVFDYRVSESTDRGGIADFSIEFGEAGIAVATPAAIDSGARLDASANGIAQAAPIAFARRFDVGGAPAFVEQGASDMIAAAATLSRTVGGVNGGIGPALRAFEAGLVFLPDNVASLMRSPLALGHAIVGLVQSVSLLGASPRLRLRALSAMTDFSVSAPPPPIGTTPARARERSNRDALIHLFAIVSAAEMVRTIGTMSFASYDDAVDGRDRVAGQLDALALAAYDAAEDERAEDFDRLRRDVVRQVNDRGGSLARIYAHSVNVTEPALTIANRLYGADGVASRAAGIAARNRVRHPGFVPGGTSIEVLSHGG